MASHISPMLPASEYYLYASHLICPVTVIDYIALAGFSISCATYLLQGIFWDRPDPYGHIYFERPQERNGKRAEAAGVTRNIAQRLEELEKNVVVFWGSQSGTAEAFAARLARDLRLRFGLEAISADLSDFDPETIGLLPKEKLAFFIMSTYGEGDPSDNASGFWTWVQNGEALALSNLHYAAFGLGNSNYKYYNNVIKRVVESLEQAGARALLDTGFADDASGDTEENFTSWENIIFEVIRKDLGIAERLSIYEPAISVVEDESIEPIDLHHGEPYHSKPNIKTVAVNSPIEPLTIKASQELFLNSDRNCVHMELDLADHPKLHYKTGDHLAVWPVNPDTEVEHLLHVLGRAPQHDTPQIIRDLEVGSLRKVPSPTTLTALFRHYLEICAPVSRSTVQELAVFAPTTPSAEFLRQLGADKDRYAQFRASRLVNIGRLLSYASPDASWSELPLSYLIEALPVRQPRYYSISSSSVLSPRRIHITALVAKTIFPDSPTLHFHGLTTNYLLSLSNRLQPTQPPHPDNLNYTSPPTSNPNTPTLYAHIRKSTFRPPLSPSTPIILIATGTGLAPFRAFILERAKLSSLGHSVGRTLLFVGCRHPDHDAIYADELRAAMTSLNAGHHGDTTSGAKQAEEVMSIHYAYSRAPEHMARTYVQDLVEREGREVVELLTRRGASLYVCGRAGMAREVGMRIAKVVARYGKEYAGIEGGGAGVKTRKVQEWCEAMKRKGKWKEDVWE